MSDVAEVLELDPVEDVTPDDGADAAVEESTIPQDAAPEAEPDTPPLDTDLDVPDDPEAEGSAETPPEPEPEPKPTPYTARVLGTQYEAKDLGLAGAVVRPDGTVEVPADSSMRLAQLVSRGRLYEQHVPRQLHEAREEVRRAKAEMSEKAQRGEALFDFFDKLRQQGEQAVYDFVTAWDVNQPKIDGYVAHELAKAERAAFASSNGTASGPGMNLPPEMIEAQAAEAAWTEAAALVPKHKGLTQSDAQDIAERLWRNRGLYLATADRDYPDLGIRRGQPVFLSQKWREDFSERAEERTASKRSLAQATRTAPKVQAAARRNAAAVQGKSGAAPPPPAKAPASAGDGTKGKRTEAEYKARIRSRYGVPV